MFSNTVAFLTLCCTSFGLASAREVEIKNNDWRASNRRILSSPEPEQVSAGRLESDPALTLLSTVFGSHMVLQREPHQVRCCVQKKNKQLALASSKSLHGCVPLASREQEVH